MDTNEQPVVAPPLNRHSIISLVLGILTLLFFCVGVFIPIPFTGMICLPPSLVLGILALIYGFVSLRRIRKHNETGHTMAWIGIVIGGMVFLCSLCLVAAVASVMVFAPDFFHIPPFLDNFQI